MSEIHQDAAIAGTSMLAMLAEVNDLMIEMRFALAARPNVRNATRGCDVRKYEDEFRGPGLKKYSFEAYLEAETEAGDTFCWWLDVWKIATGWEIHRDIYIHRRGKDGADSIGNFDDVTFARFDELRASILFLVNELVGSAAAFDFGSAGSV
jgi:hypothetical protein